MQKPRVKDILGKVRGIAGRQCGQREINKDCAIGDKITEVVGESSNVGAYGPFHGSRSHWMIWSHEVRKFHLGFQRYALAAI